MPFPNFYDVGEIGYFLEKNEGFRQKKAANRLYDFIKRISKNISEYLFSKI